MLGHEPPASSSGEGGVHEAVDVLAVLGGDLSVAVWSTTAERLWGLTAQEALHRPIGELLAGGTSACHLGPDAAAEPEAQATAEAPGSRQPEPQPPGAPQPTPQPPGAPFTGGPWSGRVRIRCRGGREATVELRVTPLPTAGEAAWLMWRPDDARERGRQHLLSEAESRIGTNLDPMETAQELADTTVPDLADYVTIDLAEALPLGSVPLGHLRSTDVSIPGFYRAGVASIHPDLRESLWGRGTPVFVPPRSPFTAVLDSRRSHFEPVLDTSPGTWLDNDPDRARVIHATGMHSLMVVPLQARGAMLGVAVFVRTENAAPFTPADLELAEDLAARASLSLDNALRYTRERMAALALQQDLLPHRLSGGSALDVAFRYLPADTHAGVGGDWFDVIPLSRDRVALVVGDVVGHGINAAATMGRLRTMVRTLAKLEVPPDRLLALVDELAVDLTPEPSGEVGPMPPVVGATCVYGVYDPATRHWTLASAGHPPPAIVAPPAPPKNATPSVTFADLPPGAPIGVGLASFTSIDVELAEGSVIALYSDGLIETRGGDLDEGLERLRGALAHPFRTLDDLCATVVRTQLSGAPTDDDTALLLARTLP